MKKLIFLPILMLICGQLAAQISLPDSWNPDSTQSYLNIAAHYDAQSTSLRKWFLKELLQGGTLTSDEIDGTFTKQKNLNRLGREYQFEATFAPFQVKVPRLNGFSWVIQSSYQSFLAATYTKDLFGLAFYGNSRYIGDSASFDGLYLQQISYQTLGAGLMHKASKSFVTLNLVNLNGSYTGQINEGYFYTASDSAMVSASLNGTFEGSYKSSFSQGLGVSLNAVFNFTTERKANENLVFQVSIKNLGVAQTRNIVRYEADTSLQFQGFTFRDIMNWNSQGNTQSDWYDTLGLQVDTVKSSVVLLPAQIQVGKIINPLLKQDVQFFYGVKAYPFIRFFPKLYAGIDYRFKQNFHAGVSASFGGFGNFRAGFYLNYTAKKWYVGLGTEDIFGAISSNAFGQMFNFRWVCAL